MLRPDGSIRWIQGQNTPIYVPNGALTRIVGTEQDVTERKRAETFVELQHAVTRELAQGRLLEPTLRRIIEMLGRDLDCRPSFTRFAVQPNLAQRCW